MSTNNHVILRSRIEVITDSLAESKHIQQIINKTLERRLAFILEKIFSQYVPHDVVIHLDKLVINVGGLDLRNLKKELPSQVEKALTSVLKEQIAKVVRNPTPHQITPLPEAKLQAIQHYLSEGNFAWWMPERSERQIEKIYLALCYSSPMLIEQFWHNLPKKEKAIQRCIACFTEATIENTIGLLLKRPANVFTSIIAEIGVLLHHTGTLTNVPYAPKKQLLAAALLGLINQQSPTVDRMGFLVMLLKQVAVKKSTSYENIIESLRSCCELSVLKPADLSPKTATKELIIALQDLAITPPKFKNKEEKQQGIILKKLDRIGNSTIAPYQLSELIDGIKTQLYEPFVRDLVKSWLREKRNRKQLAKKLPDNLFIVFIQAIDPSIVPIFSNFSNILSDTTAAVTYASLSIKEVALACCAFEYPKVVFLEKVKEVFNAFLAQGVMHQQLLKKALVSSKSRYGPEVEEMVRQWTSTAIVIDTNEADVFHSIYDIHEHVWMNKLAYLVQHVGMDEITQAFVHRILLETHTYPELGESHKVSISALDLAHKEKLTQILAQETFPIELQTAKNRLLHLLKKQDTLITGTDESNFARNVHNAHEHVWVNKLAYLVQHVGVDEITKVLVHDILLETFSSPNLGGGNEVDMPILKPAYKERLIQILSQEIFSEELQTARNSLLYLLRKESTYKAAAIHTDLAHIHAIDVENQANETIFSLENVVNFLVNGELPEHQQVPAYLIAKSLSSVDLQKIRDQLTGLCQESTMLQKLIQHATEGTLNKLVEAFIPFSTIMLIALETVVIQSKLLHNTENQTAIRLAKKIFITAAIANKPPTTETQYIARIVMHLGHHTQLSPIVLCDQLARIAKEASHDHLVEAFTILKGRLSPLGLHTIDEVDLMFLPTHESSVVQLNRDLLPIYYHKLLPAIKDLARKSDLADGYQAQITQLVAYHLPMISETLVAHIGTSLAQHIEKTIQDKRKHITQRWNLFLHTGTLGNYENVAALFKDVTEHPSSFFLEQVVEKTHVRQRLITHFTHTQLILLVQRYSHAGKEIASYIQSSYQLWCAAQGATGQQNVTKNIFWDVVLETLPVTAISFNKSNWIEQTIAKLSSALEITPTTLLQTFNFISRDTYNNAEEEPLVILLNDLQEKNNQYFREKAIQAGCGDPVLEKFYLLLNGGYATFAEQDNFTIHALENELIQLIANNPPACLQMLKNEDHRHIIARRIVHYFSENVTIKIIALLAKEKHSFVLTYLAMLNNASYHEVGQLPHLLTWKKELAISVIDYLITTSNVNEAQLLQTTLVHACYNREAVSKVLASIVAVQSSNPEEKNIAFLLKSMIKVLYPGPSSAGESMVTRGNDRPQASQETAATTKITQKKIDLQKKEVRVYTKNTGLIFLWPFLLDFFKQQNFVSGNQFVCEQSAHNAVCILQYLVTGKLKSPEWQLTLPKLLCGLSYDEVLLPYRHIGRVEDGHTAWIGKSQEDCTNEEQERTQQSSCSENKQEHQQKNTKEADKEMEMVESASQALINKVIKCWTSLEKLNKVASYENGITPNLFKSHFLNRLGVLFKAASDETTESTAWHLTIMHQVHDDLDLLPPWSMNKVKLPWMQEEIILFWMPS